MPTSMTPEHPRGEHPDLVAFAAGPLAAFNAAVTGAIFHPSNLHPDLAELDETSAGRHFALVSDWMVTQVKRGWPLASVIAEANRRIRIAERPQGGSR